MTNPSEKYFCNHCNRFIMPYELITTYNNSGIQRWKHKECGKLEVVHKGLTNSPLKRPIKKEEEKITTPTTKTPKITKTEITTKEVKPTTSITPKKIPKTEITSYDDLFE